MLTGFDAHRSSVIEGRKLSKPAPYTFWSVSRCSVDFCEDYTHSEVERTAPSPLTRPEGGDWLHGAIKVRYHLVCTYRFVLVRLVADGSFRLWVRKQTNNDDVVSVGSRCRLLLLSRRR